MSRSAESPPPESRLLPERALPAYAHTPGVTAHPIRDPDGHSHGQSHPLTVVPDSEQWRNCEPYVWGLDLFNAGYYWEAHEAWEAVWIAAGRSGPVADFLKALIKLAAAGVKLRERNPVGAERHLRRAEELLAGLPQGSAGDCRWFGLDPELLVRESRRLRAGELPEPGDQSRPALLLDLALCPC